MRGNIPLDGEKLTLEEMKTIIADGVAKHHVLFSHSTFGDSLGNLSGYLYKTEALLDWLQVNEIPAWQLKVIGLISYIRLFKIHIQK